MSQAMILNLATIAIVVGAIAFLWYKGKKKQALQIIAILVDSAEKVLGSGTGELKYDFVVSKVYPILSPIARSVISPKTIDKWLEAEVDKLQERLKKEIEKE
jgi:flagellar motor component MotA